jgi:GNAT superfamily N-acetyltransferase
MIVHMLGEHAAPTCRMRWSETLGDRSHVTIRPLEPADAAARIAFANSPPDRLVSMHIRGRVADWAASIADHPAGPSRPMVFVAVACVDGRERVVGVGELQRLGRGMHCRCDILVDADWNTKGLGTSLMRRLIGIAGALGMRCMQARTPAGDRAVADLAQSLGLRTRRDENDPAWLLHELNLPGRG